MAFFFKFCFPNRAVGVVVAHLVCNEGVGSSNLPRSTENKKKSMINRLEINRLVYRVKRDLRSKAVELWEMQPGRKGRERHRELVDDVMRIGRMDFEENLRKKS